jgi:hypothetical protein
MIDRIVPREEKIVKSADIFSFVPGLDPIVSLTAIASSRMIGTVTEPATIPKKTRPIIKNT